jgi:hypothetical protein
MMQLSLPANILLLTTAELCFHIIIFFIIILQGCRKIIIMANVSQIVNNLNDAMGKIKRNGNIKTLLPSAEAVENGYFFQFQYKTVFIAA